MLEVNFHSARTCINIFRSDDSLQVNAIWNVLGKQGLSKDNFYITNNGRLIHDDDLLSGCVTVVPRLVGGKGGFGSMLRAIGAQIEKTTNREACRDLSGRRLRDINEEKRLKAWIEKQCTREEDAAERKKKKLERLCAEPKHEFKDKNYERERSILTERIDSAVEEGFKIAAASRSTAQEKSKKVKQAVKRKTLFDDDDMSSDELDSSEDESDVGIPKKKLAREDNQSSSSETNCNKCNDKEVEEEGTKEDHPANNEELSATPKAQTSNALTA